MQASSNHSAIPTWRVCTSELTFDLTLTGSPSLLPTISHFSIQRYRCTSIFGHLQRPTGGTFDRQVCHACVAQDVDVRYLDRIGEKLGEDVGHRLRQMHLLGRRCNSCCPGRGRSSGVCRRWDAGCVRHEGSSPSAPSTAGIPWSLLRCWLVREIHCSVRHGRAPYIS